MPIAPIQHSSKPRRLPADIMAQIADHLGPEDLSRLACADAFCRAMATGPGHLGRYVMPWRHSPSLRDAWLTRFTSLSPEHQNSYRSAIEQSIAVPKVSDPCLAQFLYARAPKRPGQDANAYRANDRYALLLQQISSNPGAYNEPKRAVSHTYRMEGPLEDLGQAYIDRVRLEIIRASQIGISDEHFAKIFREQCLPDLLLMSAIRTHDFILVGDLILAGLVPPRQVLEQCSPIHSDPNARGGRYGSKGWRTEQTPIAACLGPLLRRPNSAQRLILEMLLRAGSAPCASELACIRIAYGPRLAADAMANWQTA